MDHVLAWLGREITNEIFYFFTGTFLYLLPLLMYFCTNNCALISDTQKQEMEGITVLQALQAFRYLVFVNFGLVPTVKNLFSKLPF